MLEVNTRNARQWSRMGSRATFGTAILATAEHHPDMMVLSADLGNSSGLDRFIRTYPEQFLNVGIAEQNMIGVAAGLAKEGFNVFATSFSPFIALRAGEQVRMNLGYMGLNVKAVAIGSGISMGLLGNSHYGLEEVALMRAIPNITVVSPADCAEIVKTVEAAARFDGPMYIRLTGGPDNPCVYENDYDFEIGKAITLRQGPDLAIIACGTMVYQALQAASALAEAGISATVVNMHTLKPLDADALNGILTSVPAIVTIEEHSVIGGLGSAVSEYMSVSGLRLPHLPIGLPDSFLDAGQYAYMLDQEGLTAPKISAKISQFLGR